MWFRSLFDSLKPRSTRTVGRQPRRAPARRRLAISRPLVEALEDRWLPSNYVVTDMGSFMPSAINNLGQMAGSALVPASSLSQAALWRNGTTIGLGSLGGALAESYATAINDVGQVAGSYSITDPITGSATYAAFLVTPEDTNLDGVPDRWYRDTNQDGVNDLMVNVGEPMSRVGGINNEGVVVGNTDTGLGPRGWIWQNGVTTDVDTFVGAFSSSASDINDAGQLVGSTSGPGGYGTYLINPEDTNGDGTPDRWNRDTNGDGANDLMVLLPDPSGTNSYNIHINAGGQVVFGNLLWTPHTPNGTTGSLTVLNPNADGTWIATYPSDINDSGQVVGVVSESWLEDNDRGGGQWDYHFLWENGDLAALTSLIPQNSGWLDVGGDAINNQGWIVGTIDYPYTTPGPAGTLLTPSVLPFISIGDVTVTEGNYGTRAANFTVTLSMSSAEAVTIDFATFNDTATAGSDYQAASGTLTIPAGQTTATITVLVNGDRVGEPDETFFIYLSGATNGIVGDGQGMGIILDDEPRISISDATVIEGNTGTRAANFTVTLSAASDQSVSVAYATSNGSATAGSDYQAASGTLTIPAGQTTGTIAVLVNGDRAGEANEYFFVSLSGATNAVVVDAQGVGTIVDDEPRISISDVGYMEGKKGQTTLFTFTVTLSAAYDEPVTMSYRTVDGTAKTNNSDYIAKTGTLTFAPGETTKTITIEVKGDSKKEADETFYLDLFGLSSNSLFTKNRGVGTILNDD
jgi:uncharacterized membrane protein